MTLSRHAFESRICALLDYNGAQDIVLAITSGLRRRGVYNADWVLAHACMSPEEYIVFGNRGEQWKFLAARQDGKEVAERAIKTAQKTVSNQCAEIGYEVRNWAKLKA